MKIIGKGHNTYIVEMTEADMAAIVGETYFSSSAQDKLEALGVFTRTSYSGREIRVGATVELANRFDRMKKIEYKHAELKDVGKKLRAMAALLDELGNAVIVPPAEEKPDA